MDNSPPSSLERQIDSFLEHFKRSASKAMEAEWCSIGGSGSSSNATAAPQQPAPAAAMAHENMMSQHLVQGRHVTQDNSSSSSSSNTTTINNNNTRPHPLMQRTKSRSSCLELNNMMETVKASTAAETDAKLFSTLCEIDKYNYLFLFERCKQFKVNARQLRYFEKDHIRNMIPPTHLGVLAEFEFLLNHWKIQKGFITTPKAIQPQVTKANEPPKEVITQSPKTYTQAVQTDDITTNHIGINTMPIELPEFTTPSEALSVEQRELFNVLTFEDEPLQINSNNSHINNGKDKYIIDPHGDVFPLDIIIPAALTRTQNNYKTKKLLTEGDRRLLASSIVNFFESSGIKLRPQVMANLAEQITQHFPTESKKAWYDRQNSKGRGRLYMRFYNSHRSKDIRHTNRKRKFRENSADSITNASPIASTTDVLDNTVTSLIDDFDSLDQDEAGKRIQCWLKSYKCENFLEIIEMWQDTLRYRSLQLKCITDLDGVKEFLCNWPSYKLERGHELLSIDFEHLYPKSMEIFYTRWLVYQQKIVPLLEAEVKDNTCLDILSQYQAQESRLNEDTKACVLLYLLHAITKPYRVFKTATGSVRYCISDSQYTVTRLIHHISEMDKYLEPYPCIFVLGDTLLDIRQCYVSFLGIRYKLSFCDCLIACMQMFTLLKLNDPLPSLHFWQFVRGYLFDIHKANERPYAIMENVVQYLETAARQKTTIT